MFLEMEMVLCTHFALEVSLWGCVLHLFCLTGQSLRPSAVFICLRDQSEALCCIYFASEVSLWGCVLYLFCLASQFVRPCAVLILPLISQWGCYSNFTSEVSLLGCVLYQFCLKDSLLYILLICIRGQSVRQCAVLTSPRRSVCEAVLDLSGMDRVETSGEEPPCLFIRNSSFKRDKDWK